MHSDLRPASLPSARLSDSLHLLKGKKTIPKKLRFCLSPEVLAGAVLTRFDSSDFKVDLEFQAGLDLSKVIGWDVRLVWHLVGDTAIYAFNFATS
mmetsp:Transcript_52557/g.146470  ORF Transcript_52557/g.146470 Transcript_52557/m.146470 type:complete len:95 (+) Transcript_52557:37-321(+)